MLKISDIKDWAEHFDFSISESEAVKIIDYCNEFKDEDYKEVVEEYINDKINYRSTDWLTDWYED